ncbi:MAG: response regulator [Nitrospirae bacterium]|nr:response regulator [Nitrospirota bacterium]
MYYGNQVLGEATGGKEKQVVSSKKVLVVDDEVVIVELCRRFLSGAGYNVKTVSHGNEAIGLCQKEAFDLILSDVRMPGISGLELIKTIKQIQPQMVIVIMTGHGTIQTAIEAMKQGALGFVLKPFTEEELLKSIRYASEMNDMVKENMRLKSYMGLFEINRSLMNEIHLEQLLPKIVDITLKETKADRASIMLLDPEKQELTVKAHAGFDEIFPELLKKKVGEWVSGKVAQTKEPVLIQGVQADDPELVHFLKNEKISSSLTVPLVFNEKVIGVLNASKLNESPPFTGSDVDLVSIMSGQAAVAIENAALYEKLFNNYIKTIEALLTAMEVKDLYTQGHSARVSKMSRLLCMEMKLSTKMIEDISISALLHDIGKIGIQDNVLQKPGKLDDLETVIMREHPANGVKILRPIDFPLHILESVHAHHEWWNGSGYPRGLKGEEIPLGGRIIAVADTVDSMIGNRVYRKALSLENMKEELQKYAGIQFDAGIINTFLSLLDRIGLQKLLEHLQVENGQPENGTASKLRAFELLNNS